MIDYLEGYIKNSKIELVYSFVNTKELFLSAIKQFDDFVKLNGQ